MLTWLILGTAWYWILGLAVDQRMARRSKMSSEKKLE
jgi:hypothetical protein